MNINNINVNKYPVSQVFDPESKVIFEIPKPYLMILLKMILAISLAQLSALTQLPIQ